MTREKPVPTGTFSENVASGRQRLLLFRLNGYAFRWPSEPQPTRAQWRRAVSGPLRGLALAAVLPWAVMLLSHLTGLSGQWPGLMTWQWLAGLSLVNCVFLVGGPFLWDSLCLAADRIEEAVRNSEDLDQLNRWIVAQYWNMRTQIITTVGGGVVGVLLLLWIWFASDRTFTIGLGEYFMMFETAALASNGLWILWWIVGLIGQVGHATSLRLWWHDPARTPVIMALNRALWKTGFAIMIGMVALAIAVGGLPAKGFTNGPVGQQWWLVVLVVYAAFVIVGTIFVRDAIWGQWGIFRIVRKRINEERARIDARFLASRPYANRRAGGAQAALDQLQLNQHFDSLRSVDLKLGWALTWSTSIAGAVISSVAAVVLATPW